MRESYELGHLLDKLLANAIARANSIVNCHERKLKVRLLNDHVRNDANVRANRTNRDWSFLAYEDHANRARIALEVDAAIVLAREFLAFRSPMIEDLHLSSSYDVCHRRAFFFVWLASFVATSAKDVAKHREELQRVQDLGLAREEDGVLLSS